MDPVRRNRIVGLALPIIGGMVSQNLLNIVDTAMVGFLGNAALAAVGLGGFVVFMCQALVLGFSTGVQSTAARKKGAGELDRAAAILNTALLNILFPYLVLGFVRWIEDMPVGRIRFQGVRIHVLDLTKQVIGCLTNPT